jgi:hypothetical protein
MGPLNAHGLHGLDRFFLMRNGLEWLRLLTPVLCGISLLFLSQRHQDVSTLSDRMYQHQINADIHVTRSEFSTIQNQIDQMRVEILRTIRQEHQTP